METVKRYYSLTKPRVTYGNAITAFAGFLLASHGQVDWLLFLYLSVGITLVIASACVLNNFLDQDIDSLMERTKTRAIVAGKVAGKNAVIFSVVLGITGTALLFFGTNILATIIGIAGWLIYVVLYGMLSKRLSIHGTLVGSVSGAAPILAGYVAASGEFDAGAVIVFIILFLWQMPEFYSIAIYRQKEYAAAKVPVMTVVKGVKNTKIQIFIYTWAFVVATAALTMYGVTGLTYFVVMMILGLYWLNLAAKGLKIDKSDAWAKKMFRFSLVILLVFCGLISVDSFLP